MTAVARTGPRIRDWLIAVGAFCCVIALPTSVVQAVTAYRDDPGVTSGVFALTTVASGAFWAWWMGLGSWRLTYWGKRRAVAASGDRPVPPGRPTDA